MCSNQQNMMKRTAIAVCFDLNAFCYAVAADADAAVHMECFGECVCVCSRVACHTLGSHTHKHTRIGSRRLNFANITHWRTEPTRSPTRWPWLLFEDRRTTGVDWRSVRLCMAQSGERWRDRERHEERSLREENENAPCDRSH